MSEDKLIYCSHCGVLAGVDHAVPLEFYECIAALQGVVNDAMPQIGKIALQDYERLNRGLLLAEAIMRKRKGGAS